MKFKFKGRARKIDIVVQDGDVLDVSFYRTVRQLEGHPNCEPVKRKTRTVKKDVSDEIGNSDESA